jgi:hypothetical protein
MASLVRSLTLRVSVPGAIAGLISACSPEARRVRDGGPGADPGNKPVVVVRAIDPHAADTTLWPGRAPTPLERLVAGTMYEPRPPVDTSTAPKAKAPSKPEQRAFEKSAADPRPPNPR